MEDAQKYSISLLAAPPPIRADVSLPYGFRPRAEKEHTIHLIKASLSRRLELLNEESHYQVIIPCYVLDD